MKPIYLAAITIRRRRAALAVFFDTQLEYTQVRTLPADLQKAVSSLVGFLNWALTDFGITSAAIEIRQASRTSRHDTLEKAALNTLREMGIAVWPVSNTELLGAYGEPPLGSRTELAATVSRIWPILYTKDINPAILDAAALGLFAQIERLFLNP